MQIQLMHTKFVFVLFWHFYTSWLLLKKSKNNSYFTLMYHKKFSWCISFMRNEMMNVIHLSMDTEDYIIVSSCFTSPNKQYINSKRSHLFIFHTNRRRRRDDDDDHTVMSHFLIIKYNKRENYFIHDVKWGTRILFFYYS